MTPRQQRIQRKKWRNSFKKYYDRKKEKINKTKAFMECNSPPPSDTEAAVQEVNEFVEGRISSTSRLRTKPPEEAILTRATTSREKSPIFVSPITSPTSSTCSSGRNSPDTRLRKLRYKKDKHIQFLKTQLESARKINDFYKKQITQLINSNDKTNDSLEIQIKEQILSEGLVKSFKDLKTHSAKKSLSDTLQHHVKQPLKTKRMMGPLRSIFRNQNKTVKLVTIQKTKDEVKKFLKDDENSSVAAGIKEFVKRGGVKIQKRYLNDSLQNLHKKFIQFNCSRISYATFCRFRPFWIFSASRKPIETCLCILHENFQLLVTALYRSKIIAANNGTGILREICCDIYCPECLFRKCAKCKNQRISYMEFDNSIDFFYWAWQNKIENTTTQKCYRITKKVKVYTTPKEAIAIFEKMLVKFLDHSGKIRSQRQAITNLKLNLKPNEAIIHMDFSENYKCQYAREIQSVHFGGNKQQISLHTSVLYYFDCNEMKVTQCYATASNNTRHDAAAVWAHLMPLVEFIQKNAPRVTTFHMISDSAGSQYRNLKIYFIITALHWSFSNIQHITWNFTEAGHGKGAPDGVGGVLKRTAANLVRQGKDIPDFDTFVELLKENVTNIIIDAITDYDIFEKDMLLPKTVRPYKGTQKVHQIVWNISNKSMVALRTLSCTESSCRILVNRCPHGKHLSFHEPTQSLSNPRENAILLSPKITAQVRSSSPVLKIISNVLIKSTDQTTPFNASAAFVALPTRSLAFSALSELDLPPELQRSSLDQILEDGFDEDRENKPDVYNEDSDTSDSLDIFTTIKNYKPKTN